MYVCTHIHIHTLRRGLIGDAPPGSKARAATSLQSAYLHRAEAEAGALDLSGVRGNAVR